MDRSIPENDPLQKFKPNNQFGPKFGQNQIDKVRGTALSRRIKAKAMQAKNGTAHQQHVAHEQHMANVKNNPKKYG